MRGEADVRNVTKQTVVMVLVLAMAWPAAAQEPIPQEPGAKWKALAQSLPTGTEVEVRPFEGPRLRGTLVSVSEQAMQIMPSEGPAESLAVQFANIRTMEVRDKLVRRTQKWKELSKLWRPGDPIELELDGGEDFKATLVSVSDDALNVQLREARAPREVKFSEIDDMENKSPTKASRIRTIAIWSGIAVGVGFLVVVCSRGYCQPGAFVD
jgi:small nuclear ribonucleoprotein (snRNP)-like protein